jgi:hypothetical protein
MWSKMLLSVATTRAVTMNAAATTQPQSDCEPSLLAAMPA